MKSIKIWAVVAILAMGFVACEKNEEPVASNKNWKSNATVIDENANVEGIDGTLYRTESGQLIMEASEVQDRAEGGGGINYTGTLKTTTTGGISHNSCPDTKTDKDCTNIEYKGEKTILLKAGY